MVDLRNINLDDFEVMNAPKREQQPKQRVRCTFYRVKPGGYKPTQTDLTITEMPKELYNAFFQERV